MRARDERGAFRVGPPACARFALVAEGRRGVSELPVPEGWRAFAVTRVPFSGATIQRGPVAIGTIPGWALFGCEQSPLVAILDGAPESVRVGDEIRVGDAVVAVVTGPATAGGTLYEPPVGP